MTKYVGKTTFVEIIRVDPRTAPTCIQNTRLGSSDWQNPRNRFDVIGDGVVDQSDLNVLLTYHKLLGDAALSKKRPSNMPYLDVNGDGNISSADIRQLSMYLDNYKVIDTTPEACYHVNDFLIHTDIIHPSDATTIIAAAAKKNILPRANYTPYIFSRRTLEFNKMEWDNELKNKDTIIYIHNDLLNCETCGPNFGAKSCNAVPCVFRLLISRIGCIPMRQECIAVEDTDDSPTSSEDTGTILARTVIIAIYDEADEYYVANCEPGNTSEYCYSGSPQDRYLADKVEWENLIDLLPDSIQVRAGLLQPYRGKELSAGYFDTICSGCSLPKDTDRAVINHTRLPAPSSGIVSNPRLTTDDIVDLFDTITSNGLYEPTFLLFVLDNSGSIYVSEYRSYLEAAKSRIRARFDNVEVLDDYVTARPERWIRAMTESLQSTIALYG